MNGLRIVNDKIEWCEENKLPRIPIDLYRLQQIKQDLEVLEILRKNMNITNGNTQDGKEVKVFITAITSATPEDFNKVKQWLEGNEDES